MHRLLEECKGYGEYKTWCRKLSRGIFLKDVYVCEHKEKYVDGYKICDGCVGKLMEDGKWY